MALGCSGNGIHLLSASGMKTQSVFIHAPNFYLSIWILSLEEVGPGLKFFFQFSGSIGSASQRSGRVTPRRKVICFRYSHPRRPSILCPVPGVQRICNQTTIPQSSIWCFVPKHLPSRAGPVVPLLTMILCRDAISFDKLTTPISLLLRAFDLQGVSLTLQSCIGRGISSRFPH